MDRVEKEIDKILSDDRNINVDFVVHVKNKEELDILVEVLEKYNFSIQFTLFDETLRQWMNRMAGEDNYDTCFRIRNREDDKCVAINSSLEHWRLWCNNIIEFEKNEVVFFEGKYTRKTAEVEAEKIISNIKDGDESLKEKYGDRTKEQIIEMLLENK